MATKAIEKNSIPELKNIIANHRRQAKVDAPYYIQALEELAKRTGQGLDFEKSFALIQKAALERQFLSYKQLAEESGTDWSKVHYAMNGHLGDLIEYAHRRGWPLLSAIVVNQKNVGSGDMEPTTLAGFTAAARELGYVVTDELEFLREQQQRVFEWAASSVAQP